MNIIITGASKGIGKATALSFCRDGNHSLFLVSRDAALLELARDECLTVNPGCRVYLFPFDLGNTASIGDLVPQILERTQTIDVLINNAGILFNKRFDDISVTEISSTFNTNFFAPATLIRLLLPALSGSRSARVINIGSMGGYQGSSKFPGLAYYSASKAAISVLTECLAEEYKDTGIIFSCLALGGVQTEMFSEAFPGIKANVKPSEMADYIVRFTLEDNSARNGKIIPVLIPGGDKK